MAYFNEHINEIANQLREFGGIPGSVLARHLVDINHQVEVTSNDWMDTEPDTDQELSAWQLYVEAHAKRRILYIVATDTLVALGHK